MTQDTQSKWVVRAVAAAILTLLGFFSLENYRLIMARMDDQRTALTGLMARGAERDLRVTKLEANEKHILDTLMRIEQKQEEILQKVRR